MQSHLDQDPQTGSTAADAASNEPEEGIGAFVAQVSVAGS